MGSLLMTCRVGLASLRPGSGGFVLTLDKTWACRSSAACRSTFSRVLLLSLASAELRELRCQLVEGQHANHLPTGAFYIVGPSLIIAPYMICLSLWGRGRTAQNPLV